MSIQRPSPSLDMAATCSELDDRLRADPSYRVESLLRQQPHLGDDPAAVVDLIYTEYAVRCERHQTALAEEILARFPQHAVAFKRQLKFDELADDASPWGALGLPPSCSEKNSAPSPPGELPAAQLDGRYALLEEIGRGGVAVVYRAWHAELQRTVAVKVLASTCSAALQQRLLVEGRLLARLHHANIVQVYDIGHCNGSTYLALEYCDRGTLADRIAAEPLAPSHAAALVHTLALGIHRAHEAGVVHRDLKPANVLFDAVGTPKIADFGLAKIHAAASRQTRTGAILGTPCYMAPEQLADASGDVTASADIYALGAILYELLTGRPPLEAANALATLARVQQDQPAFARRHRRRLPADLRTICLKCLEKSPHARYGDAQSLAEDLERFLAGRPVTARRPHYSERAVRAVRRRPLVWGLAAALALSLAAGGGVSAWKWHEQHVQRIAAGEAFEEAFLQFTHLYQLARDGVATPAGRVPIGAVARQDFARRFTTFLDRYTGESPIRHDVVIGYALLAELHRKHREPAQASACERKALAAGRRYIDQSRSLPPSGPHLPSIHYKLAAIKLNRGERSAALDGFWQAVQAAEQYLAIDPGGDAPDVRETLARAHGRIARILSPGGDSAAGVHFDKASRHYRAYLQRWPDDPGVRLAYIQCLTFTGGHFMQKGPMSHAFTPLHDALHLCRTMPALHDVPTAARHEAEVRIRLARFAWHNGGDAMPWYQVALQLLERAAAAAPLDLDLARRISLIEFEVAQHYLRLRRQDDALAAARAALSRRQRILAVQPTPADEAAAAACCQFMSDAVGWREAG